MGNAFNFFMFIKPFQDVVEIGMNVMFTFLTRLAL